MDWSGVDYLWIIAAFLSAVWTLILTAPIHCKGSIGETVMKCCISPNLMKKQTNLHLGSFCGCFSIARREAFFFSPDHNQAPISSYCSGWKAISCIPADVLWDMNDLIKSHAKVPGDVGLALRQMKAAPRALQTGDAPERLGERLKAPTAFRSPFSVSCPVLPRALLPNLLSLKFPSLQAIKLETGPCSYVIMTN